MIKIPKAKKNRHLQTICLTDSQAMNATHGKCSLYLTPEQANFNITNASTLIRALQDINLISQKINSSQQNTHYFTGDKYLDYIAYMGCAPTIRFEADPKDSDNNSDFCFIKIHNHQSAKLIHSQTQARAPHCPNCKKPVKNWQDSKTDSTIHCNQCHSTSNIEAFDWRKTAGYAQLFIEITDIFPREAIPQQILLDKLASITDVEWLYFYSCR